MAINFSETTTRIITVLGRLSILMVIPCFHAYGLLTMIGTSICGAEIIFLPKFEEHSFLNAIQTYKPNTAFLVMSHLFVRKKNIDSSIDFPYIIQSGTSIICISGQKPINRYVWY